MPLKVSFMAHKKRNPEKKLPGKIILNFEFKVSFWGPKCLKKMSSPFNILSTNQQHWLIAWFSLMKIIWPKSGPSWKYKSNVT